MFQRAILGMHGNAKTAGQLAECYSAKLMIPSAKPMGMLGNDLFVSYMLPPAELLGTFQMAGDNLKRALRSQCQTWHLEAG